MRSKTRRSALASLACAACLIFAPAYAQDYPHRVITVVTGYAPGGPSDVAIRTISDRLSAALGQPIVVENVAGAGGMTGALRVARAAPDGYTLLIHQTGLAIGPALYPKLGLDVEKELTPIGLVNTTYSFLAVRKSLPADTLPDLIAWMKGPGRPAKFAHPGTGTLAHLQAVLFAQLFGLDINLIPYRGGGPAMNDVVAGHADMVWAAPSTSAPLIASGAIKSPGYAAGKRLASLSDIPSFVELGHKELEIPFWHALFAPSGTPEPIIQRVNAALRETLADPKVQKAYADLGLDSFPPDRLSPEAARTFVHAEIERWGKLIRDNNIQGAP